MALAKLLKTAGVDLLDVTSGGLVANKYITVGPAYQLPFATRIKKEVDILVSTVGMITDAQSLFPITSGACIGGGNPMAVPI